MCRWGIAEDQTTGEKGLR